MVAALPMLFKYRSSTLQSAIDEYVTDPAAQSVLGAQWPYMGLPPSQLSFMAGTGVWMALMDPGPVYVKGSFQRLADALAAVVIDRRWRSAVRRHGVTRSRSRRAASPA